ncbi:MAG: sulfatase-like hydrolase/transferase [Kiritimatiellae bacterium]|nr:sulfatase-like hydrolase/transferase [Kiritimatiellia bacterium]
MRTLREELARRRAAVGAKMPSPDPAFNSARPRGRAASRPVQREGAPQPNFVLINVDDLGWAEIGPFGAEYPMQHLDRKAREGRLLRSPDATPVCSPSRAP